MSSRPLAGSRGDIQEAALQPRILQGGRTFAGLDQQKVLGRRTWGVRLGWRGKWEDSDASHLRRPVGRTQAVKGRPSGV